MWQLSRQNIIRPIIGQKFLNRNNYRLKKKVPDQIRSHDLCRPRFICYSQAKLAKTQQFWIHYETRYQQESNESCEQNCLREKESSTRLRYPCYLESREIMFTEGQKFELPITGHLLSEVYTLLELFEIQFRRYPCYLESREIMLTEGKKFELPITGHLLSEVYTLLELFEIQFRARNTLNLFFHKFFRF